MIIVFENSSVYIYSTHYIPTGVALQKNGHFTPHWNDKNKNTRKHSWHILILL